MKISSKTLRSGLCMAVVSTIAVVSRAQSTVPTGAVSTGPTLAVGDLAPALKASRWVKGTPVTSFEAGKVYVVEFWATWCGPCKAAMPHLSEIARKDAGKVTFTSVDVYEHPAPGVNADTAVDSFVQKMGSDMDYNVCRDTDDKWMATHWMEAAKQPGIPCSFIIDASGKIAWIGHPMSLDTVLDQVVAGTFDAKAYAETRRKKMEVLQAQDATRQALMQKMNDAAKAGDFALAVKEADTLEAVHPELDARVLPIKFLALLHSDVKAAGDLVDDLAAKSDTKPTVFAQLGQRAIATDGLSPAAYLVGVKCIDTFAAKGVAGTNKIGCYVFTADGYFKAGDKLKAIENGEKALSEAKTEGIAPENIKMLQDKLDTYEAK